jgi:hypothetical protein
VFSLSAAAQLKLAGLYQLRSTITYPVRINTIDDRDFYDILSEGVLSSIYFESLRIVQYCIDLGTKIKDKIRGAQTLEDLQNIKVEDV